jgi:hypothetical protein
MVAKGEGEPTTKALTVNVAAAPKVPVIGSLSASATAVAKGGKVTLTWSTENANDVSISGVGKVDASGSRDVSLSDTTTYKLTARGPGGSVDSQPVRITVEAPKPVAAEKPATPPPPAVNPEVALAAAAVDSFKSAYEAKSIDGLQKAWPSMPGATRSALAEAFKLPSKYSLSCKPPSVNGDNAQTTCAQVINMGGKTYNAQLTVDLQKSAGAWRVVNQKGTQR